MTPKNDIEDQLDVLLNSEEFLKVKNIASNIVKLSVDKLDNFVTDMKIKREKSLPAVRNENIVKKSKKDLAFYKGLSIVSNIFLWVNIITAFVTLMGFFISADSEVLKILLGFFLPIIAALYFANGYCKSKIARLLRYNKYLSGFGKDSVATIKNLAIAANVNEEMALKDIKYFIDKDYLKQARLVEDNKILILDNESYRDYTKYIENIDSKSKDQIDSFYISQLITYKKNLPSPMSQYASEILDIISKFSSNSEQAKNNDSYVKFKNYYIPETVGLFEKYENLSKSSIKTSEELELKKEIENSLSDIIKGLKKLLESMFEMNYINIKSDISVLKSMLKNDGYMDEDFK